MSTLLPRLLMYITPYWLTRISAEMRTYFIPSKYASCLSFQRDMRHTQCLMAYNLMVRDYSWGDFFTQLRGIFFKNYRMQRSELKIVLFRFVMCLLTCILYVCYRVYGEKNELVKMGLLMILRVNIGSLGQDTLRETAGLFISQRKDGFRQYQQILGLSVQHYTAFNLFYMMCVMSLYLLPFYLTLNYYQVEPRYVLSFACFIISSSVLTLLLSSLFTDQQVGNELIALFYMMTSFLPFLYKEHSTWMSLIAMAMPNSAFTISILEADLRPSLVSLGFVKLYLILLAFTDDPFRLKPKCKACLVAVNQWLRGDLQESGVQLNQIHGTELNQGLQANADVLIEIAGVTKTYLSDNLPFTALNNFSLSINKKCIYGLLGKNGAGKTTLIDIITGVSDPTSGTCRIHSDKPTFGVCYQHEILYGSLTAREHLYFYSLLKLMPTHETIDSIMESLELAPDTPSKELSGGNKRKLSIAIAILNKPQLLIFDEPTSGLDPLSRLHIWAIFEKLNSLSTILLTTHHFDQAEKLAHQICIIEKGVILVKGTAASIRSMYGKSYLLAVEGNIELRKANWQHMSVEEVGTPLEGRKYLIRKSSNRDTNDEFESSFIELVEAIQQWHPNCRLTLEQNSLEDSFIEILKQNSTDSIQLRNSFFGLAPFQRMSLPIFRQTYGVFLKNIYFHQSRLHQSLFLYFINVFMLLLTIFFSRAFGQQYRQSHGQPQEMDYSKIIMQGYMFLPIAYIGCAVYEKEKRIRQVLNTRGVYGLSYWLGCFLFDYGLFLLNLALLYLIAPTDTNRLTLGRLLPLGLALIPYAYCCSFLFSTVKAASTYYTIINLTLGFLIVPVLLYAQASQSSLVVVLQNLKYLYPMTDLLEANLFNTTQSANAFNTTQSDTLFICILFYILLLILLEARLIQRVAYLVRRMRGGRMRGTNQLVDANAPAPAPNDAGAKLSNVSKSYGSVSALEGVSYELGDERLALLGHNGAGKSTTFRLLSCQLHQSSGDIFVSGKQKKPFWRRMDSAGVCYQDDALWQNMQVGKIMQVMCILLGIDQSVKEQKYINILSCLQFEPANLDKRFAVLSGGNKRKICLAVALLGCPNLRLLDQCTTGLDPSSRLAMLDAIQQCTHGATLFTTHSMKEAHTLCQRVVIMAKGKVLEYDRIQSLKKKYFDCRWMELRPKQPISQLLTALQSKNITVVENTDERLKIEIKYREHTLSGILKHARDLKKMGLINSYQVIEPNLETVYLKVTA